MTSPRDCVFRSGCRDTASCHHAGYCMRIPSRDEVKPVEHIPSKERLERLRDLAYAAGQQNRRHNLEEELRLLKETTAIVESFGNEPTTGETFPQLTEAQSNAIATSVVQNVCELPDYNSPEDQPELLQCTVTELHHCVMSAIEASRSDRPELKAGEQRAAERMRNTLEKAGYLDLGGELWKPPLGPRPPFMDALVSLEASVEGALKWLLSHHAMSTVHAKNILLIAIRQTEAEFVEKHKEHIIPPAPDAPLWFNYEQMREVARLCNPSITDSQFNAMWAERMLKGPPQE